MERREIRALAVRHDEKRCAVAVTSGARMGQMFSEHLKVNVAWWRAARCGVKTKCRHNGCIIMNHRQRISGSKRRQNGSSTNIGE